MEEVDDQTGKLRVKFIDQTWKGLGSSSEKREHQFMNWLFTLHAGGIAGGLTYAASKPSSSCLVWAIGLFAAGLVLDLVFAARMYYNESATSQKFQQLAKRYYEGSATWNELVTWNESRRPRYMLPEIIGWIAGLIVIPAVILLIVAIS